MSRTLKYAGASSQRSQGTGTLEREEIHFSAQRLENEGRRETHASMYVWRCCLKLTTVSQKSTPLSCSANIFMSVFMKFCRQLKERKRQRAPFSREE